jgi:predicted Zn-dependent peptidase
MTARNGIFAFLACLLSLFTILFFSEALSAHPASLSQSQASEHIWQLPNGLEVYFLQTSRYALNTAVLAIRAGSSLESARTSGLSHLLEHALLFRQKTPSEKSLWQKFRENGLYLNAHTELENMFFETSFPGELLETALNLLSQVVFDGKISEEELEKEKQVVLKELKDLSRDPFKVGLATIYSLAFPASPYGQPVFGHPEAIKAASLQEIKDYHARYFKPERAALVIIGSLDPERVKNMVKEIFSVWLDNSSSEIASAAPLQSENLTMTKESRQAELTMNVSETYLMAGLLAPAYNDREQALMDVLVEILGYGVNPLLYSAFSGYPDLVSSVRINYFVHARSGLLVITAITRKEKIAQVKRLLQNFFKQLSEMNFSPEDYPPGQDFGVVNRLLGAKNRLRLVSARALENPINLAISLGRDLLLTSEKARADYWQIMEKARSSDLRKLAYRYFNQGQPVWVIIKPEEK